MTDDDALTEAAALQRAYRQRRLRWCRKIGAPVKGHETEPDPAVIDGSDPEEG